MNLLYHQYHNICARVAFFSDHEAFGSFYGSLDDAYDSIAERLVGLSDSSQLNLHAILDGTSAKCKQYPQDAKENTTLFQAALQCEVELKQMLESLIKAGNMSEGTKNLLAQLSDDSESRVYKIKARIKK
jgi:DNA-binding ferritin-like protein